MANLWHSKKLFSKKLWLVLSVVLCTLMSVLLIANSVISVYYVQIDGFLGIKRSEIVGYDENAIYYNAKYDTKQEVVERSAEICEQLEGEGLVLMKNENNALPLDGDNVKVSLFGNGSVNINCSAQGQRINGDSEKYPTLKEAFESVDVAVNEQLWNFNLNSGYTGSLNKINEVPWSRYSAVKSSFSQYGDAAIFVVTRDSIEGSDAKAGGSQSEISSGTVGTDGTYLSLSVQEKETLKELTKLKLAGTFDRIVVLLNTALCVQLDFDLDSEIDVDSIMWIGNTGSSGVYAVAKAIVGDINPSGKLSDTYVYDNFSSPAGAAWKETGKLNNVYSDASLTEQQKYYSVYNEGIYVGYRYYETRYADVVEGADGVGAYNYSDVVAYPFGYGLSYSEFTYSNYQVEKQTDNATGAVSYNVSVDVSNADAAAGGVKGKEVVQVYLQKPYTQYARQNMIEVSAVELVGFKKVELEAGASTTVEISVSEEEFTSYDTYGFGTYVLDSGDYYLAVGNGAHEAVNNILAAKEYDVDGNGDLAGLVQIAARDVNKYAVSSVTGNEVSNKLADMDPNTYAGSYDSVTYVSRSNWEGTFPQQKTTLTITPKMVSDLQNLTEDDIPETDEAMPEYGKNNGLTLMQLRGAEYNDADGQWEKLLDQMTFEEQNTLITLAMKTQPIASVMKPETINSDGPTYVKDTTAGYEDSDARMPCEGIWASTFNADLIYETGVILGSDCILSGIDGFWGVGVNIHRSPFGGRVHEYFSEDPFLSGIMAWKEVQGVQGENQGIIVQAKHFAFNDQEENRSGAAVWLNEQSAREIYLEPWKYVVAPEYGHSWGVMTSFNRAGCKWTSACPTLIEGILRDEFGFEGYTLTDLASGNGASYMTELDGLLAGTDSWLNYNTGAFSFEDYQDNATVANAMREACHRILYVVCNNSIAMNGIAEDAKYVFYPVWYEVLVTTCMYVVGFFAAGSVVMYAISKKKNY